MSSAPSTRQKFQEAIEQKQLPFREHLIELRTRVLRSTLYVFVGFGVSWFYHQELFDWLMAPLINAFADQEDAANLLSFRSLIEPIIVYLKTALIFGALFAMPAVLTEGWLFVAPGLHKNEKRLAFPFLISSVLFFLGGALFCRYVVLAPTNIVLLGFGGDQVTPLIMMDEYFSFTSRMLFVFGALFELPVVMSFLAFVGLVDHYFLIRHWRISMVLAFVVGAMLTPPDPMSQIALAVPLIILYGLSIFLAWMIGKMRNPEEGRSKSHHHDGGHGEGDGDSGDHAGEPG